MSVTVVDREDGADELTVSFAAPPVVQAFIEDPAYATGYFGPFGCAKTSAGAMKGWSYSQVFPGGRGLVVRDTWPNLRDTTLKTFNEWFPDGAAGDWEAQRKTFWLKTNGAPAEIMFKAMDDERDVKNALSLDIAWAWFDEPQGGISLRGEHKIVREAGINHTLFQAILGRVGRQKGYPGMVWLTGNPPDPDQWIAKEFRYEPGKSGQDPPKNPRRDRLTLTTGGVIDNDWNLYLGDQETNRANLAPGYYEVLERIYGHGTPMSQRFLQGKWIAWAVSKPFNADWITWAGQGDTPSYPETGSVDVEIAAGVDPAVSTKDSANRTAIVVVAQIRSGPLRGRIFVLACLCGHWTPARQAAEIVKAVEKYDIRTVRIEKVAYQEALEPLLVREAQDADVHVNVELKRPVVDKLTRANAWAGLVENNLVIFMPGCEELPRAMLAVPDDESLWDPVDAAGLAISHLPRLEADQTRLATRQDAQEETRTRGYAVKSTRETIRGPQHRVVMPGKRAAPVGTNPSTRGRAIGYAVRRPHVQRGT